MNRRKGHCRTVILTCAKCGKKFKLENHGGCSHCKRPFFSRFNIVPYTDGMSLAAEFGECACTKYSVRYTTENSHCDDGNQLDQQEDDLLMQKQEEIRALGQIFLTLNEQNEKRNGEF